MTAPEMRVLARETVLACGGRGFMRFADGGDALLVSDAARRCESEGAVRELVSALEGKGFAVSLAGGLLMISPGDELLLLIKAQEAPDIRWEDSAFAAQALAARLLSAPKMPLTAAGRALVNESLRLTGRPGEDVLSGLDAIRARAAVMLRSGDRSGMHEAGAILSIWCDRRNDE